LFPLPSNKETPLLGNGNKETLIFQIISDKLSLTSMKKDIHPEYFPKATMKCACGAVFEIGSTKEFAETEICSQCHPFYTGKEKIVDTLGRVEKFKKREAQKRTYIKKSEKKTKLTEKKASSSVEAKIRSLTEKK